jgi:NAD(P)-dependent dehydrogenase (short-subunit alcohol dehydrogenase family)
VGYFKNKVVVVTGAGSGIGRACVTAYGKAGARVFAVDIDAGRLGSLKAEADAALWRCETIAADCADPLAVGALADRAFGSAGRVDVVQNGAGILLSGPAESFSAEEWERIVNVNIWSMIHSLRAFLPRMLLQKPPSHIVNIASFAGLLGFPYTVPYSMTKFAAVGLSEALAIEVRGRGVYVTAVCPGAVRTNLFNDGVVRLPGEWGGRIRDLLNGRAADPEKVARRILAGVEARAPMIIPTREVIPLWWQKRLMDGTFRKLAGRLTALAAGGRRV